MERSKSTLTTHSPLSPSLTCDFYCMTIKVWPELSQPFGQNSKATERQTAELLYDHRWHITCLWLWWLFTQTVFVSLELISAWPLSLPSETELVSLNAYVYCLCDIWNQDKSTMKLIRGRSFWSDRSERMSKAARRLESTKKREDKCKKPTKISFSMSYEDDFIYTKNPDAYLSVFLFHKAWHK